MKKLINIIVAVLAACLIAAPAFAANTDNPSGCLPSKYHGVEAPFAAYQAADAQTIVEGDPVKLDGAGQVVIGTASDSSLLGFARSAVTGSTAGDTIYVYNDPDQVYRCQCSGTFAIAMIGTSVDLEGSTGIFEVNENAVVTKAVRIVGYDLNDIVGANTRVFIQLNMSELGPGSSGVVDDLEVIDDLTVGDDASIGGDLALAGALDINANKFNVAAASGDTTIAGTLGVTGAATVGSLTDGTATLDGSGGLSGVADLSITGDFTLGGHKDGLSRQAGACYGASGGAEWVPGSDGSADFSLCALPQSITAKYGMLLCDVAVGEELVGASLMGFCTESNALTLDAAIVKCAKADGTCSAPTATSGFVQVDSCAAAYDQQWSLDAVEVVSDDFIYGIRLLGTTAASDTIDVSGAHCVVNGK